MAWLRPLIWIIWVACVSSCSRYALIIPDAEHEDGALIFRIPESYQDSVTAVANWLRNRRELENTLRPSADSQKTYFVTPWKRDSSLRFYFLQFDTRGRHLSEWKAQWTLKARGPRETQVEIKVLEVIYAGPPNLAGPLPATASSKSAVNSQWFETDPDHMRAVLEARRFWNDTYPTKTLPMELANVTVPSLNSPPTSKELTKRKWQQLKRPRTF